MANEPTKVEGVDYSPEGIEAVREQVIVWRDNSYEQWPQAIDFTVVATHLIALLAYLKVLVELEEATKNE